MSTRPDAALIVFAKAPEPGQVKTRLTTLLTPEEAAELYEAFIRDALDQYETLGVEVLVYLAGARSDDTANLFGQADLVAEQQGTGLGARMQHAFARSFAMGFSRLVIIGTDHPTLPSAFIERAFEELRRPRTVVLGPSADGGYYVLGMNEFYPQLFADMTYSHGAVFEQTVSRASGVENTDLVILPEWYDVDDPESLRRLVEDLEQNATGRTQTREVMRRLQQQYGGFLSQHSPDDQSSGST